MKILTFALVLRRMSALTNVFMLCQRLGGTVTYISAADGRANIVVSAPRRSAHRFAPQLRRIMDVLELIELRALGMGDSEDSSSEGPMRQLA